MLTPKIITHESQRLPFGHLRLENSDHFKVFSDRNQPIELCIYSKENPESLLFKALMQANDTSYSLQLSDLPRDFTYTYCIEGLEVFDPYSRAITSPLHWKEPFVSPRSIPSEKMPFDWRGIVSPDIPKNELFIYEAHVRGFTASADISPEKQGTYEGMTEKISYLKELGVNAIELMPIQEFDENEENRVNYWGYNTLHFFQPKRSYSQSGDPENGLKTLIRELHKAHITVILDVVYNHVPHNSPLFHLAPDTYFVKNEQGEHENFTGCGNTLNTNHPQTMDLILSSLRHFVQEYHVDGFRFDLASIFCRNSRGEILKNPPILKAIEQDPILSKVVMIGEVWDAAGLYQVGKFPSPIFFEWNAEYRDRVRRFINLFSDHKEEFISAISGSKDLFETRKSPHKSINFLACHDGFTLLDTVSYREKHNHENGEQNRDGHNASFSNNWGIEGESDHPDILTLRDRQFGNFMTALLFSIGIPMLSMGDEYGKTQFGNNNAYCQDKKWNWMKWDFCENSQRKYTMVQQLAKLRKKARLNDTLQPQIAEFQFQDHPKITAITIDDKVALVFNVTDQSITVNPPGSDWVLYCNTSHPLGQMMITNAWECPIQLLPFSSLLAMQLR